MIQATLIKCVPKECVTIHMATEMVELGIFLKSLIGFCINSGTLVRSSEYVYWPDGWIPIPNTLAAIIILKNDIRIENFTTCYLDNSVTCSGVRFEKKIEVTGKTPGAAHRKFLREILKIIKHEKN